MKIRVGLLCVCVAVASLAACSSDSSTSDASPAAPSDEGEVHDAMTAYVALAHERYATSLDEAKALREAVDAFLGAPSEEGLAAARAAWLAARDPYGETEVFRYFGGPIDDEATGVEGQVNSWPLDEAFIDYTEGAPGAGIINHPEQYPNITRDVLAASNEKDGEANIATGYHAIEFLLWGQDKSDTGPGARPFTDYTTAPNADRRSEYLRVVTDLLVDDLELVVAGWDATKDASFAQSFSRLAAKDALTKAFRGVTMLAGIELSRERMFNAFHSGDQEEEHSCFSDNTTSDLRANARGIENVYVRGGLGDVVVTKDAAVDADVRQKISAMLAAVEAIPAPFDRAIVDLQGRAKVQAAIDAVKAVTSALIAAAKSVGVEVDIVQ